MKHKAFTLIELVIVISIIGIISAILIPSLTEKYSNAKSDIVEIMNDSRHIRVYQNDELIYDGKASDFSLDNYQILDIEYEEDTIIITVKGE